MNYVTNKFLLASSSVRSKQLLCIYKAIDRPNFSSELPPPAINDDLRRRLDLLILLIKRYTYSCKLNEKHFNDLQFINKIKMQWKIKNLS